MKSAPWVLRSAMALALSIAACLPLRAQMIPVKIALASSSVPGGVARLAKEMGLFAKHGIDATVVPMDTNTIASMALISGSVQFFTAAGAEGIVAQARGQDVVGVAAAYKGIPAVVVIANKVRNRLKVSPDAPITDCLRALDGLTIAGPAATSGYTLGVKSAAAASGAAVKFTFMSQQAMPAALESGAVDGFISSSPFYVMPVLRGTGTIWLKANASDWPKESAPANSSELYTMRSFAQTNPDTVKRVRAAFEDVGDIAAHQPEKLQDAIRKVFPELEPATHKMIFDVEMPGFITTKLTTEDMEREIAFVKLGNSDLAGLDDLNPENLFLK